ncbi:hypothetical protein AB0C13_08815 [Streptomyces sp. NPDC049099]|uniref:hypothetical protein n=1 Tax=Streptomyces sp. NPDC049099 TaxID=3155768 RepID=UPI0034165F1E
MRRIVWLAWMAVHFNEYGYSQGPLRATVGTVVVLLAAVLVGYGLNRHRPAALTAAGLTVAAGIGWLACH